jgi:hypothetical protein
MWIGRLWSRIEQKLWTGPVVMDYGVISEGKIGRQHRKLSVILAGKEGRTLFLRASYKTLGAAGVEFIEMDRETATRLQWVLQDALRRM